MDVHFFFYYYYYYHFCYEDHIIKQEPQRKRLAPRAVVHTHASIIGAVKESESRKSGRITLRAHFAIASATPLADLETFYIEALSI